MTNTQVRMIAAVAGIFAGGVVADAGGVDENVGLFLIIVFAVIFAGEYVRSYREDRSGRD